MSLEFTAVPPVPRGMSLAGPPLFIDDAYCRWMQDVLVDRPGQIRMRGPLKYWLANAAIANNESALGACEHYTTSNDWRGAVFCATGVTSDGAAPSGDAKVYVYKKVGGIAPVNATGITLPFKLITKYDTTNKRWINNTIISANPALHDGVWITVFDDVTNNDLANNVAALLYWRGAGLPTINIASGSFNLGTNAALISHNSIAAGTVESGMFVFSNTGGRYLGTVASVDTVNNTVTLEKDILGLSQSETYSGTIRYMSFRGFVHQYGRGLATNDGGNFLTSGRLGSDSEGLFSAARVTVNADDATHEATVYRQSDHAYVAKVVWNGTQSNTQVEISNGTSVAKNRLQDENYFIMRNDTNMYNSGLAQDSFKFPMDLNNRRPDQRPNTPTLSGSTVAAPAPGLFNATYANRQWFASFNTNSTQYDKFINRVVFSGTDNSENINLCQDASDSIVIPGKEPIRGIAGSNAGLLVFVESKTYIIKGTNRSNFSLEELYPDGTLSTSSIVQVGGGVIWAGKQGIYYYDGVTVRNFTNETLGIYYTDGIKNFDVGKDRVYAFINNNYLVINFTNWYSNYTMKRWESEGTPTTISSISGTAFPASPTDRQLFYQSTEQLLYIYDALNTRWTNLGNFGDEEIIKLTNTGAYSEVTPDRITFNIYLPTGAIGTLSNFAPRGYMTDIVVMNTDTTNKGSLLDMKSIFTENIGDFVTDTIKSNDIVISSAGTTLAGPDFFLETKQYNFGESTLNKWWRKLMFNLSINKGYMMVEFVDINNNSLVSATTGTDDLFCNADESGFFLIPPTNQKWKWYQENQYSWNNYWASTISSSPYIQYLSGPRVSSAPTFDTVYTTTPPIINNSQAYLNTTSGKVFVGYQASGWVELTSANGLRVGLKFHSTTNNNTYTWDGTVWANPVTTTQTWNRVFRGSFIRFSRWIGFRQNSLGFKFYSLRNYKPDGSTENIPEVVNVNDWVFGLKPLRKGRN
jgi:hypothetical protein